MARTSDHLSKRRGVWWYHRRVPRAYADLDDRAIVQLSTGVAVDDDPQGRQAAEIARRIDAETVAYWRALEGGASPDATTRYETAIARARAAGFAYRPLTELAGDAPIEELVARLDRHAAEGLSKSDRAAKTSAAAYLGGEPRPGFRLSELPDVYERLAAADLSEMSENQKRRHMNARRRAVAVAQEVIGDLALVAITREEAQRVRARLAERAVANEIRRDTGAKALHTLAAQWRRVDEAYQLGLAPVWSGLRIGRPDTRQAKPATIEDAKRLLTPGALESLNPQARGMLWIVMGTGARPSEVDALDEVAIRLNDAIPHIAITGARRPLKVAHTARAIPLAGVALAAAQAHPSGFPRYFDKSASWSAAVGKALRGVEGWDADVKAYGFRHLFKDRLRGVGAPDSVMNALMGHKDDGPKYGAGYTLPDLAVWMEKTALTPEAGWRP